MYNSIFKIYIFLSKNLNPFCFKFKILQNELSYQNLVFKVEMVAGCGNDIGAPKIRNRFWSTKNEMFFVAISNF